MAPLGFGEWGPLTDIATTTKGDRPLAAQFRQVDRSPDAASLVDPRVTVFADDGAVVYVNGTEIGRSNLPEGSRLVGTATPSRPDHTTMP